MRPRTLAETRSNDAPIPPNWSRPSRGEAGPHAAQHPTVDSPHGGCTPPSWGASGCAAGLRQPHGSSSPAGYGPAGSSPGDAPGWRRRRHVLRWVLWKRAHNICLLLLGGRAFSSSARSDSACTLAGIMGSVVSGMAMGTGSAVAHRAVDSMMGPRQVEHVHTGAPAPAAPGTPFFSRCRRWPACTSLVHVVLCDGQGAS